VLSNNKNLTEESLVQTAFGAGNNANPFLTHAKFAPAKGFDEQITS